MSRDDEEFSAQLAIAENTNLRERLGRLEASIAFWAADVDEANAETARLRRELEDAKSLLRQRDDANAALEKERETLIEAVAARDSHIAATESRVIDHDLKEIDERRTRSRLQGLRRRIRSRLAAQSEEIEGLRRTVALGHAARQLVEDELRDARTDSARSARYLDRVETRLREAEAKLRSGAKGRT